MSMNPVAPRIVRSFERPPAELIEALSAFGVATVHEAAGQRGLMRPEVGAVTGGARICGPAVTSLNHAGDNLMLHAAIETCRPGDVLVVATTSPSTDAMLGELIATQCRARGIAGMVLDAGVRDVAAIRAMRFPAWACAVSAAGTSKSRPGWVNVPVTCGGALVRPGDVVIADDDGVVIVEREALGDVVAAAAAREEREAVARERYQKGELSLDVLALREILARLGVRDG